ncbi:DUF2064 domain-containing protein [Candidatus Pacearchaeota archaeon]|nr:DUF2064 domain-containing protein [Candidatus Pacearchaeota archaeon]
MKKEKLLILFSKWPKKGNSKSRMTKVMGEKATERFCLVCLDDLIRKTSNLDGIDFIVVPNTIKESRLFTDRYGIFSTSLEHLDILPNSTTSEIFNSLFNCFLDKYKKVSLIPMDVPHIDVKLINESFEKLKNHNQVFGPEENGGVYLIGLSESPRYTFDRVRWSTKNSFKDLIKNSESPAILELSFDLNEPTDLTKLNNAMLNSCPHLARFIKSLILERIMIQKEAILI